MGTAGDFYNTLKILAHGGLAPPQAFYDRVEAMWNYGAYVVDPNGCLPRNGDADLCGKGYSDETTAYFNRSDWTYVYSNGKSGTPPPSSASPSVVFPWAGQVCTRSLYYVHHITASSSRYPFCHV